MSMDENFQFTDVQARSWALGMRHLYKAGKLSQSKIWKLEQIPGWSWEIKGIHSFLPFDKARTLVRSLHLKSYKEWCKYRKSSERPKNIPSCPNGAYKEQWKGYGDWLGTGTIATFNMEFESFESAREYIHNKKLKSVSEWTHFSKSKERPSSIPTDPARVYKEQWLGFGDWLGTGTLAPKDMKFDNFEAAKTRVRQFGLKSQTHWREFCKIGQKPPDIPSSPSTHYKKQWKGWGDWLGTGNIAVGLRQYLPFNEARALVHKKSLWNSKKNGAVV